MGKKEKVLVNLLVDASGSMGPYREKTIDMINEFIEGQKKEDYETLVSLTTFDTEAYVKFVKKPLKKVGKIDKEYQIGGMTALLDAIGLTVKAVEKEGTPDKVVFAIITDGWENASKEYTKEAIKELIKEKEKAGDWSFIYLSSSLDAFADSASYGFSAGSTITFDADNIGDVSMALQSYTTTRTMTSGTVTWEDAGYNGDAI